MKILYATDGSSSAREAGLFLARLKLCAADQIRILVVDESPGDAAIAGIVEEGRKIFSGSAAAIDTLEAQGYADEEILAACQQWPADMVVIGAKGATGLKRFLLGGVTSRILRHAPCSVLVVRSGNPLSHRILGAFDDSHSSRDAALFLASLPFAETPELELVSVLPPLDSQAPQRHPSTFPSGVSEIQVIEDLSTYEARLLAAGCRVSTKILRGDPAGALIDYAEARQADLIVLGSHGSSLSERFHRFLLGSVSEKVARYASGNVLVVRHPGE